MSSAIKPKNLHVPLPQDLYAELKELSKTMGKPATKVARMAIEQWTRASVRVRVKRQISAYAHAMAGSDYDLMPELEQAALAALMEAEKKRK
jgi:hypothetical protein